MNMKVIEFGTREEGGWIVVYKKDLDEAKLSLVIFWDEEADPTETPNRVRNFIRQNGRLPSESEMPALEECRGWVGLHTDPKEKLADIKDWDKAARYESEKNFSFKDLTSLNMAMAKAEGMYKRSNTWREWRQTLNAARPRRSTKDLLKRLHTAKATGQQMDLDDIKDFLERMFQIG